MSEQIVIVNKPIGKTPLEMVDLFKEKNPQFQESTISYAGRLDPMAHGLLLLLVGEENKNRENYLHLDKTYEVEILFGFETDTYDLLGKVPPHFAKASRGKQVSKVSKVPKVPKVPKVEIQKELQSFVGKREQEYPPYSSKTVHGIPLFKWARDGKLSEIEIPKREIEIFSIVVLSEREVGGKALLQTIKERIALVMGDFRQESIREEWEKNIDINHQYQVVKIKVSCSSGVYMRSLAHELGKRTNCNALAFDIYRTKIGDYTLEDVV